MVHDSLQPFKDLELNVSEDEKVQHTKYLLQKLLPYVKQLNLEQMRERELEARIRGTSFRFILFRLHYQFGGESLFRANRLVPCQILTSFLKFYH